MTNEEIMNLLKEHEKPTTKGSAAPVAAFSLPASSITNADALTKSAFSIIEEYHPSAYLLLQSREKWQKLHNFKRFGVFTLASASTMMYPHLWHLRLRTPVYLSVDFKACRL